MKIFFLLILVFLFISCNSDDPATDVVIYPVQHDYPCIANGLSKKNICISGSNLYLIGGDYIAPPLPIDPTDSTTVTGCSLQKAAFSSTCISSSDLGSNWSSMETLPIPFEQPRTPLISEVTDGFYLFLDGSNAKILFYDFSTKIWTTTYEFSSGYKYFDTVVMVTTGTMMYLFDVQAINNLNQEILHQIYYGAIDSNHVIQSWTNYEDSHFSNGGAITGNILGNNIYLLVQEQTGNIYLYQMLAGTNGELQTWTNNANIPDFLLYSSFKHPELTISPSFLYISGFSLNFVNGYYNFELSVGEIRSDYSIYNWYDAISSSPIEFSQSSIGCALVYDNEKLYFLPSSSSDNFTNILVGICSTDGTIDSWSSISY